MRQVFAGTKGKDRIKGTEQADDISGSMGLDYLFGNGGDDVINGGPGWDYIVGGAGHDTLTGGRGRKADTFFFHSSLEADADVILDFKGAQGQDQLLFNYDDDNPLRFAAFDDGFWEEMLIQGTTAQDEDDFLIYDQSTGHLYYDADGSGAGQQVLVVTLANKSALVADDIGIYRNEGWPF